MVMASKLGHAGGGVLSMSVSGEQIRQELAVAAERGGPRFSLALSKGTASEQRLPPRRPDCVVSADPVALLLVGLGRRSQWGQIAKGKLASWGTRPWLALKLTSLFQRPDSGQSTHHRSVRTRFRGRGTRRGIGSRRSSHWSSRGGAWRSGPAALIKPDH